jgi:hypothetical protein
MPRHATAWTSPLHAIPISGIPAKPFYGSHTLHVPFLNTVRHAAFSHAPCNVIGPIKRLKAKQETVYGGDCNDHPISNKDIPIQNRNKHNIINTIEQLHLKLKDDYTVRWELDRYLLAIHYCFDKDYNEHKTCVISPELMVLETSDTYHYHNLPDLAQTIRSTLMGVCCTPWLQKLFNMFLCGKRYRRLVNTSHTTCQLTSAIINTLHGLLLGLYPFNERRMDIRKRAWIAGTLREVLTDNAHLSFINQHPYLICLGLAEYIINFVDDFCPVEWALLGLSHSSKSQCLAVFESFREASISDVVDTKDFWAKLESESQPIVSSIVKFFRDASFYQHKQRTILPPTTVNYVQLALTSKIIQNSCSIFGQLKASIPTIQFRESEALEDIWTSIYIRSLPTHTAAKQMECLTRIGCMCYLVEEEIHHFPVCLACALTRRTDTLKGMFRYDDVYRRLVCNDCVHHEHVVNVNLLGRVLYIRDKAIMLCELCLSPKYWDSVCTCTTDETIVQRTCCACHNTNIATTKEVVDVQAMEMKNMYFCYKHSLSCVLNQATVYDLKSLEDEICARHQSTIPCGTRSKRR